ncbi:hypothetical protein V1281_001978 [Nitrobacteraceae bacterium AZCC 2161]
MLEANDGITTPAPIRLPPVPGGKPKVLHKAFGKALIS